MACGPAFMNVYRKIKQLLGDLQLMLDDCCKGMMH